MLKFVLVARLSSHDNNGNIGFLGHVNSFRKSRLIIAPSFTAFGVLDAGTCVDSSFNSVKRRDTAVLASIWDVVTVLFIC